MTLFYIPFGYLLKFCCIISDNQYVLALFFFALIMQIVLFPLGIKQQKSSVNMAKMKPKEQIIREKYKGRNDRPTQMKMQQEIQDLYRNEGVSQLSGCLPLLIQLPLILILFGVVRYPLSYCVAINDNAYVNKQYTTAVTMLEEAKEKIAASDYYLDPSKDQAKHDELKATYDAFTNLQKGFGATIDTDTNKWNGEFSKDGNGNVQPADAYGELNLVSFMQKDAAKYEALLASDYGIEGAMTTEFSAEDLDRLPSFDFMDGYTFLDIPNSRFKEGFVPVLVMLIIPLLVFLSSFFSGVLTRKFMGTPQTQPDGSPIPGNGALMKWGMPALSTYFALTFPLAIGAYWIFRTILQTLQQFILSKMYPLPVVTEAELEEARRQYKGKKKKVITIEVDEDDDSYDSLRVEPKDDAAKPKASGKVVMLTGDEPSDEPKAAAPESKGEKPKLKEERPESKDDKPDKK